ncbi:MAG TPA: GNAT family N-acetyltransferase [Frankiaceae bacterium]|nr:GNAT family N-acetyltransferase [Frankiaceae bacterium]
MTVEVTFATEADEGTYASVHRVITAVVALEGAVGWLSVPPPEETAAWLDEQLAYAAAGRGGVALVSLDGRVEALGVWSRYTAPVVAQNAEVRKVMTHPDARGRGLARVVVEALTEHAREHGVEVLVLDARGNNHAAHALYESLGWRRCGLVPDFIAVGEHRWDRVFFAKRVTTPPGAVLHGSDPVGPGASVLREAGQT